jgi:hypothetical protein
MVTATLGYYAVDGVKKLYAFWKLCLTWIRGGLEWLADKVEVSVVKGKTRWAHGRSEALRHTTAEEIHASITTQTARYSCLRGTHAHTYWLSWNQASRTSVGAALHVPLGIWIHQQKNGLWGKGLKEMTHEAIQHSSENGFQCALHTRPYISSLHMREQSFNKTSAQNSKMWRLEFRPRHVHLEEGACAFGASKFTDVFLPINIDK